MSKQPLYTPTPQDLAAFRAAENKRKPYGGPRVRKVTSKAKKGQANGG